MMNSKNENIGLSHHHTSSHHQQHHHHHHHHSSHGSSGSSHHNGNSNGSNQSLYGQQTPSNGNLLNQNSNSMNGMNAKLFSTLQSHQSSSPSTNGLNLQQQIMMQSPTVNMNAIAAYGQQPALLNNNSSNNLNQYGNNNGNSNNNYNDDLSYNSSSNMKQISSIQWYEVEIKGLVKNISPKLWQWTHLRCLYLNDNNLMRLPPVIASLNHLQCLDASNNKIRTLPSEIGDMTSLRELYLNNNQIRVLPFEFGKLFKLSQLGLKGNPLTQDMMAIFMEPNGTQKLLIHLLDQLTITCPPPPRRPWMILAEPSQSANTCIFTTMCYNVLCDKYATRQYYGYCPAWALTWDYRKKLILDDIKNFNADVITLQELETEQFYQFFLPELRQFDYDGIFSPKSRAKTMGENDKKHVDGCAIFFKTSRFSIVKDYLVEFNQIAMATAEGSEDMLNRVMTKDNIGLAALLEVKQDDSNSDLVMSNPSSKSPNGKETAALASSSNPSTSNSSSASLVSGSNKQLLLVCTAHIHWDPDYCDVKLIQTLMFTNEIKQICEQAIKEFRPNQQPNDASNAIPVVICADLNSLPESGVIEYLRTGKILANHNDFKDLGYDSCLQKINTSDKPSELSHNLKLDCAYDKDIMPYTNYTFDFKGMIDYIFYSRQLMRTVGLLGPLDMDWIKSNRIVGFPHPHVPSDHLPLMVELELITNNQQMNLGSQQQTQHMSNFQTSSSSNSLRSNSNNHHYGYSHHNNHHHSATSSNSSHNNSHLLSSHQQINSASNSSLNNLVNSSSSTMSTIGQMISINSNNNNSSTNSNNSNNNNTNNGNFNYNFLHSNLKNK